MKRKHSRGHGPSQRQLRIGEEVRHVLAELLERDLLRDPRLSGVPVTVTEVRMSPDMKVASVFVMPLGGRGVTEVVAALNHATAFLRVRLAGEMQLRYAPRMRFLPDVSFEQAGRIGELLHEPTVARDLVRRPEEDEGADDDSEAT
jgi:ribosome-binding factor A